MSQTPLLISTHRSISLIALMIISSCSVQKQLADPCIEKGKVYRSLGSLKSNFVDVDKKYLSDFVNLSKALPDNWVRTGAESGDMEIWVIDYSTVQDGKYYFQFKTQHRHILYPTFPEKSQVKLPCTLMVSFELDQPGGTRIYGSTEVELTRRGAASRTVFGSWEFNRTTNRIEFTEEGGSGPTLYWQL